MRATVATTQGASRLSIKQWVWGTIQGAKRPNSPAGKVVKVQDGRILADHSLHHQPPFQEAHRLGGNIEAERSLTVIAGCAWREDLNGPAQIAHVHPTVRPYCE